MTGERRMLQHQPVSGEKRNLRWKGGWRGAEREMGYDWLEEDRRSGVQRGLKHGERNERKTRE